MVMPYGVVKWFDSRKGYGFINGPDRDKDIFVYWKDIEQNEGYKRLHDGDAVEYEVVEDDRGIHAEHVRVIHQPVSV
jgi:CspA family cold shock protein